MAAKKEATYQPDGQYRVVPAKRLELFGQTFYPGHDVIVRGDVLAGVDPEDIRSAVLVCGVGGGGHAEQD